jgi:transcriptional regulator with PAS, ATPase and Fis domain
MSDRQAIVSDPEIIRARAMETLFERLENLCEGAIAIDRAGHVVYVNEKCLHSLRLNHASEAIGRPIEEIIPNSLMRRVAETGEPILLDISASACPKASRPSPTKSGSSTSSRSRRSPG